MTTRSPLAARVRSVSMLGLLTAVLPLNLVVTGTALLVARRRTPQQAARPRTVLVSGGKMTKALALCRAFHDAGHRVVLIETSRYRFTGHRFSRAVDAFHVVPAPDDDDGYAQALLDIVRAEGVDVYVPVCSPVASRFDAQAAELLAAHCEVVHADVETVTMLDNKYRFARRAESLGLAVPDTHRVTDARQVTEFDFDAHDGAYILKNLAYDPVNRLDLTPLPNEDTAGFASSKAISDDQPWILQQLVAGTEYCTHSTVRDGRITVYACCESSPFQINYGMVDKPDIEKWVRAFVEPLGVTGQLSFDFIEDAAGRIVAIECNPRTHSAITMFYNHPDVAAAYLGDLDPDAAPLTPRPGARPTYWLYHEVWRLVTRGDRGARLRTILRGKDAIFALDDPLPFLLVHHLQVPSLLLRSLWQGRDWVKIDFNIGKLVEPGGD